MNFLLIAKLGVCRPSDGMVCGEWVLDRDVKRPRGLVSREEAGRVLHVSGLL